MTDALAREGWRRLIEAVDGRPTAGTVAGALADARDLPEARAFEIVEAALEDGPLAEEDTGGAFPDVTLPDAGDETAGEEADVPASNPTPTGGESPSGTPDERDTGRYDWSGADFARTTSDTYPPALLEREQWMGHIEKRPFSPWADRDHPEADPEKDARYKWGLSENYATGDRVALAEDDPRLDGRVFIQQESDPFAFVDGDDILCPETGEVHPAFIQVLERLGVTYADVSTSESGIHANYQGALPNDQSQAVFEIDTEPWGANDSAPTVEIYDGKHVCVATGEHVHGTPLDVNRWDDDGLRDVLEQYDALKEPTPTHDTDQDREDLEDYEPTASAHDERTSEMQDILKAVDRLRPRDLRLRTSKVGTDSTGWEKWDPSSYRTSSGGDSLHRSPDESVFHDHKHGEAFGLLSLFAAEQGIISNPWDRLDGAEWWETIDLAREHGAPIPEYVGGRGEEDAEPVAPFALGILDHLTDTEAERYLRKRDLAPSTDDARDKLRDMILREMRAGNSTVLDAPTSLGKSYTAATTPWLNHADVTGEAPVVHFHPTRARRDEAAQDSEAHGGTYAVLRGRDEISPLARGDHDPAKDGEEDPDIVVTADGLPASEWLDMMCNPEEGRGLPFSTALALLRERNDQGLEDLPPLDQEDPAVAQWNGIPRTDAGDPAVDVIHATNQFAYVPSLRRGTNVLLDEQPDYATALSTARIRRLVGAYLREIDAPVATWEAFVSLARWRSDGHASDTKQEQDALQEAIGTTPSREWYAEDKDAHALAPDLTRALWQALRWEDTDRNGRRAARVLHEPPRLDDEDGYAGAWLGVTIDEQNDARTVRVAPDFGQARSVIGLDAHPTMSLWQLNVDPGMVRDAVLDPTERQLWRRYERGLTTVGIGEATRPRSGANAREWTNTDRIQEILRTLRAQYGDGFKTAISTKQVEPLVRDALAGVVDDEIDDESTMHYGGELGLNRFGEEDAGYIYGCMDPGDDMILDALAELGLDARPVVVEDEDGNEHREKGRTFEGPDADTAAALLASVRENHVAQAAGRYARNPDAPENQAVVFVDTSAVPAGFLDYQVPGVEWLATDLQAGIVDELTARPSATTADLAEAVGCSKEHVRKTLARLGERGLIAKRPGAGNHGADVYQSDGADHALVDLGLEQIATNPLQDSSRWSLAIYDRESPPPARGGESAPSSEEITAGTGGDGPPDRE